MNAITIKNPDVAIKLTPEQFKELGIDIKADEIRLEVEHFGMWQIPTKAKGLCTSVKFGKFSRVEEITLYGNRTMFDVRQGGYELEGRVSIQGKKYTAFTSACMFETPTGHLINVGVIHARVR